MRIFVPHVKLKTAIDQTSSAIKIYLPTMLHQPHPSDPCASAYSYEWVGALHKLWEPVIKFVSWCLCLYWLCGGGGAALSLVSSSFTSCISLRKLISSCISLLATLDSSLSCGRRRSLLGVVRAVGRLSTSLPCCVDGDVASSKCIIYISECCIRAPIINISGIRHYIVLK